jgi:hypothetical protein
MEKTSEYSVLTKKWLDQNKRLHRKRILQVDKRIDNSLPEAYKHPLVKSKKELLIEGK